MYILHLALKTVCKNSQLQRLDWIDSLSPRHFWLDCRISEATQIELYGEYYSLQESNGNGE